MFGSNDLIREAKSFYNNYEYDKAIELLKELEKKLSKNDSLLLNVYFLLGDSYDSNDEPTYAIHYLKKFIHTENNDSNEDIFWAKMYIASSYNRLGKWDSSYYFLIEATKDAELRADKTLKRDANFQLAVWYYSRSNLDSAEAIFNRIIDSEPKSKYTGLKAEIDQNLGIIAFDRKEYNKAITKWENSISYYAQSKSGVDIMSLNNNLGNSYKELKRFNKALFHYEKAKTLADSLNHKWMKIALQDNIGMIYYHMGNYDLANEYLLKGLSQTDTSDLIALRIEHLESLHMINEKSGNHEAAYNYLKEFYYYRLKNYEPELNNIIEDLRISYNSEVLERENLKKTAEARQNLLVAISLAFIIALLSIIGFFYSRNQHQKQALKEQRITALQQEMVISSSNALQDGQEQERKRIATSLHDAVGATLSAAKLHFSSVKSALTPDKYESINKLIDEAADETRRISHNILPPTLLKFGLSASLEELAKNLSVDNLSISYKSDSPELRIEERKEISLYRICQELVSNAIRHGEASEIDISMNTSGSLLHLAVQDNGKGMNTSNRENWGIGLTNIESRVRYFNGEFTLRSVPEDGTEIQISLPS